jgi:U3 small nucleolar RNA-associated protein 13
MWDNPSDTDIFTSLHCRATERAHDKDINSIAVSPNDKYVVTASQDKTAKVCDMIKIEF